MGNNEIELKEEELLFIKSLESKLNVTEYSELRRIINKYMQIASNKDYETRKYEEKYKNAREREDKYYKKYIDEENEKIKWENYYREVCNKYAKLEIELDLAKAKIETLEGEKNNANRKI